MPNLRGKTWTTTTPAYVEDAQYWEDHLISDADAAKITTSVQSVNNTTPDAQGNVNIVALPSGGTAGQVLTKQSSAEGDADWENPASSGHTIIDENGDDMPYRTNLQFTNAEVTDDSANDTTIVDCKGEKGDPGQAATITVGTTTTLPAGSSATVTNSGTSSAAVFNFGIPKGADGSGAGDMLKADYDPNSVVELAGGIPDYVASQAYTLPTAASNVLGGVKVGTNLSIDANGVLSATDTNTDALHDLTDVNISLPSNGQALLYNSTSGKWENGDVAGSAADISYDNTSSGLTADDVQEAIDEIDSNLDTLDGKVYKTDDSTETTIASDDLLPIYDTSATASKKITVANVVKATVSNPNLLDNPFFTINQRGATTYTSSGRTAIYSIDRWKLNSELAINSVLEKTSSGIDLTLAPNVDNLVNGGYGCLENLNSVSDHADLNGKIVTLSTIVDGNLYSKTFTIDMVNDVVEIISIGDIELQYRHSNNSAIYVIRFIARNTQSVQLHHITAVKLEVGSVSTLALDTAPNYATELLKCQRYFVRFKPTIDGNASLGGLGFCFTANQARAPLQVPVAMRTNPVVSTNGIGMIGISTPGELILSPSDITSFDLYDNVSNIHFSFIMNTTNTLTVGKLGYVRAMNDVTAYIDLSADL